jgi:site-specific recombinase XerD
MIVVLWRAGLRIHEALALAEHDLDARRGSLLVRRGKGGRRREVGMDQWGWEQLRSWSDARAKLPIGPRFCIVEGPTRGRPWSGAGVRGEFRRLAAQAGVGRRFAPHQPRRALELELERELAKGFAPRRAARGRTVRSATWQAAERGRDARSSRSCARSRGSASPST